VAKITQASNEKQLTKMLIPDDVFKIASPFKLVLLEDFDRYLDNNKGNNATMSSILNALDGVFSAVNVIRFFSANDPEIINKNCALSSRMNRILLFELPNIDQARKQIYRVYTDNLDHDLVDKLAIKFVNNRLSMRYITNYLCRFLDENDKLLTAYDNFDKFIDELMRFNKYNDDIKKKQAHDTDAMVLIE
jgi:SpoVK/Ycf46/Vps4 family AAA+-type ATPase